MLTRMTVEFSISVFTTLKPDGRISFNRVRPELVSSLLLIGFSKNRTNYKIFFENFSFQPESVHMRSARAGPRM
jgi:hypothetical protein